MLLALGGLAALWWGRVAPLVAEARLTSETTVRQQALAMCPEGGR